MFAPGSPTSQIHKMDDERDSRDEHDNQNELDNRGEDDSRYDDDSRGVCSKNRKYVLSVLGVGLLLMVILLPLSFSGVEYYEIALKKQKSTGKVNLERVYTAGLYLIGPDFTFKSFNADAHFEELKNIVTFSSDKVEVTVTCAFQYFLRPEDLPDMHEEYDIYYKPVVRTSANAAIKSTASDLSINQYIRDRVTVERVMFEGLKKRLEGQCCRKECTKAKPCINCIKYSECKTSDKGLFVEVRYFQFLDFDIHDDVKKQYLRQVTEKEQEEEAKYKLEEKVVRKVTEQMKSKIANEASEISQNATAQVTLIRAKVRAEALLKVERARNQGLSLIYDRLNITTEEHKASFNYLRALREQKNAKFNIGYKTLMAKD